MAVVYFATERLFTENLDFSTKYWLNDKQWFIKCFIINNRQTCICTIPYDHDSYSQSETITNSIYNSIKAEHLDCNRIRHIRTLTINSSSVQTTGILSWLHHLTFASDILTFELIAKILKQTPFLYSLTLTSFLHPTSTVPTATFKHVKELHMTCNRHYVNNLNIIKQLMKLLPDVHYLILDYPLWPHDSLDLIFCSCPNLKSLSICANKIDETAAEMWLNKYTCLKFRKQKFYAKYDEKTRELTIWF
ncbi:unnamed protein product [Didymodactylos carnosus]|uniref:Uncharacterized protein n=1 Tax=Didymodactylos carnosus TaxID=1234261 RepID=A0A814SGE2_9BILA|nr:unnamed protein product [Didymodactylos carnosus]CAF1145691.1 unnamed protein product [Didymodactylos carnosus]CAF3909304.1 unnamed protein product [Didymodactylos carnosus]CAF3946148.1 unnamed protein product [Didymodactylos carnosus]